MSWAEGSLCGIDIETTGGDPETARIVAVAMVFVGDPVPIDNVSLLINPGVPIPAEATALHGITTERVRADGLAPAEALQSVVDRLDRAWRSLPVIGFDIVAGLTVLDREMRRHLGRGLAVTGPVVDPHVIDRALDRRPGTRTLEKTCKYYAIRHDGIHDATENALAAARLAWRLAKCHPDKVGRLPLNELHRQQIDWAQEWGDQLTEHRRSRGRDTAIDGTWPLRPYTNTEALHDHEVLDAIHLEVLSDWEDKLRTDGPQLFLTELHIVNDTRAEHPYFTSIRCLPYHVGCNDAFPIAVMGVLANVLAADRVVVAWEPSALELVTLSPSRPRPERPTHTLILADVVCGIVTRLAKYPYTPPDYFRTTPFSYGRPEVVEQPAEKLPAVIEDLIRFWREPSRDPKSEFMERHWFLRVGYDITDADRPTKQARRRFFPRLLLK